MDRKLRGLLRELKAEGAPVLERWDRLGAAARELLAKPGRGQPSALQALLAAVEADLELEGAPEEERRITLGLAADAFLDPPRRKRGRPPRAGAQEARTPRKPGRPPREGADAQDSLLGFVAALIVEDSRAGAHPVSRSAALEDAAATLRERIGIGKGSRDDSSLRRRLQRYAKREAAADAADADRWPVPDPE